MTVACLQNVSRRSLKQKTVGEMLQKSFERISHTTGIPPKRGVAEPGVVKPDLQRKNTMLRYSKRKNRGDEAAVTSHSNLAADSRSRALAE